MEQDWVDCAGSVFDIEIEALENVKKLIGTSFSNAVDLIAHCRGRIAVTGIGKSGIIGKKLTATLSSTGTSAYFLHPVEGLHGDLGAVHTGDIVIAFSYSGKSSEINAILPLLREKGVGIISITSDAFSPMGMMSDITIDCTVPREACPMNLAPTSSTTAMLALGDALAVCLMQKKSFTANDFKKSHPGGALGKRLSCKINDLMHTTSIPLTIETATMKEAISILDKGRFGVVLVIDNNAVFKGILTDGDIRRLICHEELHLDFAVSDFMRKNPRCGRPEQAAAEILDIMEKNQITVLPVIDDDNKIKGIVHLHDLLGKGQVRFAG